MGKRGQRLKKQRAREQREDTARRMRDWDLAVCYLAAEIPLETAKQRLSRVDLRPACGCCSTLLKAVDRHGPDPLELGIPPSDTVTMAALDRVHNGDDASDEERHQAWAFWASRVRERLPELRENPNSAVLQEPAHNMCDCCSTTGDVLANHSAPEFLMEAAMFGLHTLAAFLHSKGSTRWDDELADLLGDTDLGRSLDRARSVLSSSRPMMLGRAAAEHARGGG